MATIRKRLSSRIDPDGRAEVLLRFSAGRGMVFRLRSGIRVPAVRWNARTEGAGTSGADGAAEEDGLPLCPAD